MNIERIHLLAKRNKASVYPRKGLYKQQGEHGVRFDFNDRLIAFVDAVISDETTHLRQQLDIAINGITETIEENLHLADGDNCTLIKLKQAIAQIRELEK